MVDRLNEHFGRDNGFHQLVEGMPFIEGGKIKLSWTLSQKIGEHLEVSTNQKVIDPLKRTKVLKYTLKIVCLNSNSACQF